MRFDRMLIGALLLGMLALASSAYGISISVSNNAGGFTENINAGDGDSVFGSTIIGSNRLSNSIEGSGSLKGSHSVSNRAGANAGVGVDIRNAERYSYDYYLSPDKTSKSAPVMASEELDVLNAEYIEANAQAFNAKGYTAEVSTVIHDPGNQASLIGYRNIAMASKDEAMASQTAESAFAPDGSIQAYSGADFMQLKSHPLRFRWDTADASIRVDRGSVEGYSDLASASANGAKASQQMEVAMGSQIQTKSQSESLTASLFQSLKKTDAKVGSTVEGTLAGYNGSVYASKDYAEAGQTGHVSRTFSSTALAGKERKTRNSNYPEYDFDMQARKDAYGSSASGALEFYVDDDDPSIGSIQGAVDASDSGDSVNVAPGTYYENVYINKSLSVKGAGASNTIVDGQQTGSVFTIGKIDTNVDVTLVSMTIQGGTGTPIEFWPGYTPQCGGGIFSYGTMELNDSIVSGNTADYGGGIFNRGKATVIGTAILENTAYTGGGISNDATGKLTVIGSTVSGNIASQYGYGGGIYNYDGIATVNESTISENTGGFGGGILSSGIGMATLNIDGCIISKNTATDNYGGGVINLGYSKLNINGSIISENAATYGGGIYNSGNATIADSTISANTAYYLGGGILNVGIIASIMGCNITENSANYGGGIFNEGMYQISTTGISSSNISKNTAKYDGGGIFNSLGPVTIASSTISENTAYNRGGGFFNNNGGEVHLESGSIDHNTAYYVGGGIYNDGTITGNKSLVHDNTPDQIAPDVDWLPAI